MTPDQAQALAAHIDVNNPFVLDILNRIKAAVELNLPTWTAPLIDAMFEILISYLNNHPAPQPSPQPSPSPVPTPGA